MAYMKQTWANGDIITAEKLNYMEDGIATSINDNELKDALINHFEFDIPPNNLTFADVLTLVSNPDLEGMVELADFYDDYVIAINTEGVDVIRPNSNYNVSDYQEDVTVDVSKRLITGTFKEVMSSYYYILLHMKLDMVKLEGYSRPQVTITVWDGEVINQLPDIFPVSDTGDAYLAIELYPEIQNGIAFGVGYLDDNGDLYTLSHYVRLPFSASGKVGPAKGCNDTFFVEATFVPSNDS